MRAVARTVKTGVCSLARCVEADIRAAADALKGAAKPRSHVFIATSPLHRAAKLNMTREQVLDAAVRSVRLARIAVCGRGVQLRGRHPHRDRFPP